jgi:hypothetical protein
MQVLLLQPAKWRRFEPLGLIAQICEESEYAILPLEAERAYTEPLATVQLAQSEAPARRTRAAADRLTSSRAMTPASSRREIMRWGYAG